MIKLASTTNIFIQKRDPMYFILTVPVLYGVEIALVTIGIIYDMIALGAVAYVLFMITLFGMRKIKTWYLLAQYKKIVADNPKFELFKTIQGYGFVIGVDMRNSKVLLLNMDNPHVPYVMPGSNLYDIGVSLGGKNYTSLIITGFYIGGQRFKIINLHTPKRVVSSDSHKAMHAKEDAKEIMSLLIYIGGHKVG